jgi:hypothetical protein
LKTENAKTPLVKALIFKEILTHRVLVKNACQNELSAFEAYLKQKRVEFEAYPIEVLEGLVNGIELRGAA